VGLDFCDLHEGSGEIGRQDNGILAAAGEFCRNSALSSSSLAPISYDHIPLLLSLA
jgi:hypothetical protein